MPIIGKYPVYYTNFKGELVKRLPDSQLPKLGPGMENPYMLRNLNQREKYAENRRLKRRNDRKNNS